MVVEGGVETWGITGKARKSVKCQPLSVNKPVDRCAILTHKVNRGNAVGHRWSRKWILKLKFLKMQVPRPRPRAECASFTAGFTEPPGDVCVPQLR